MTDRADPPAMAREGVYVGVPINDLIHTVP